MKILKIYSDGPLQNIVFNEGFNVVLAKISNPLDKSKDSHNLGKTSLVHLIDFLLLKEIKKDHFFMRNKSVFKDYTFYALIKTNDDKFVTIKRSVSKHTKVSFIVESNVNIDHRNTVTWHFSNLPIRKAKTFFNQLLSFNVTPEYSYRESITYFLRTQLDYNDVFQLGKFNRSDDKDWKPLLFNLLGFNDKPLVKKYEYQDDKRDLESTVKKLESRSNFDDSEIDKIQGLIQLRTEDKKEVEKKIDKFNFYITEKEIKREVIEKIEEQIAELNSRDYDLSLEKDRIEKSFETKQNFNLESLNHLFSEIKVFFSSELKKDYEDLIIFNKKVTEERSYYLKERLSKIKNQLSEIHQELISLNSKRSQFLEILRSDDTFVKFKEYQLQLVRLDADISDLRLQMKSINSIEELRVEVNRIDNKIDACKKEIVASLRNETVELYKLIRITFSKLVRQVLGVPAIISISPTRNQDNISFSADIQSEEAPNLTDEGKGATYRKILCASFDLALLITYSKMSYFKFVYHDGIFEGLDNRMKWRLLETVSDICRDHGLQYILTVIEDDLPRNEQGVKFYFNNDQIAVVLSDTGPEGKLFKKNY